MIKSVLLLSSVLAAAAIAGCGGSAHPAEPNEPTTPAQPMSNEDMAAKGGQLYGAHCAKCHGDAGQGVADKGPAVVGADALPKDPRAGAKRQVPFSTAYDVGAWVMEHMPADKPGSLKPEEYLAILAFDLKANGVELPAEPLTVEGLKTIVLHP